MFTREEELFYRHVFNPQLCTNVRKLKKANDVLNIVVMNIEDEIKEESLGDDPDTTRIKRMTTVHKHARQKRYECQSRIAQLRAFKDRYYYHRIIEIVKEEYEPNEWTEIMQEASTSSGRNLLSARRR